MKAALLSVLLLHVASIYSDDDVQWCTERSPDYRKCMDLSYEFTNAGSVLAFSCSLKLTKGSCSQEVGTEPRTMTTIKAGELYHAQRRGGNFKVALAEDYSNDKTPTYYRYYSVAVVKAGRPDLKLLKLKGKRVCHGKFDETGASGWDIPISFLSTYHRKLDLDDRCHVVDAVNKYFGASCLPDPGGTIRDDMRTCAACSTGTCSKETKYRGYGGALLCLVEDAGEVAFLTHTTVSEWVAGKEQWAANLKSSDFRLLCPDGTQVTVGNYQQCNVGWMRPNVVVVNGEPTNDDLLQILQLRLRNPPTSAAQFIFKSTNYLSTSGNVLFSDDTKELRVISGNEQNPKNYLGGSGQYSYVKAMDGLYCVGGASKQKLCISILLASVSRALLHYTAEH